MVSFLLSVWQGKFLPVDNANSKRALRFCWATKMSEADFLNLCANLRMSRSVSWIVSQWGEFVHALFILKTLLEMLKIFKNYEVHFFGRWSSWHVVLFECCFYASGDGDRCWKVTQWIRSNKQTATLTPYVKSGWMILWFRLLNTSSWNEQHTSLWFCHLQVEEEVLN